MSASTKSIAVLRGQENKEGKSSVQIQPELGKAAGLQSPEKKKQSMKKYGATGEGKNMPAMVSNELESKPRILGGNTKSSTTVAAIGVGPSSATSSASPAPPTNVGSVEIKPSTAEAQVVTASESLDKACIMENLKSSIDKHTHVSCPPFVPVPLPQESAMVHYQVAELALMMESLTIVGVNARTFAMIEAFRSLLNSTPVLSGSSLSDTNRMDFEQLINVNFEFIRRRRAPSVGMTHVKDSLLRRVVPLLTPKNKTTSSTDNCISSPEVQRGMLGNDGSSNGGGADERLLDGNPREVVLNVLAGIEREMQLSIKSVVEDRSLPCLSSNDTILVFGRSSTVELILLFAASNPRLTVKPKVIVVDSAPLYEGRALAGRLTCSGLNVTYALIAACSTLMPHCTRVFIGAAAVLQNGDVFNRCGTAIVATTAKRFRKPVLCFAESFKFIPEVWLGNLGQNTKLIGLRQFYQSEDRIRSPSGWAQSPYQGHTSDHRGNEQQHQLQQQHQQQDKHHSHMGSDTAPAAGYLYDLTPAAYIDTVVCEMGLLHTSAIVAALQDREDRDAYLIS